MVRRGVGLALSGCVSLWACHQLAGIDDDKTLATVPGDAGQDAVIDDSGWDSGAPPTGWDPRPPPRPAGAAAPSGKGVRRYFAARKIYLGSVSPTTQAADSNGWRSIGHAIDGEDTTVAIINSQTSQVCNRPGGSSPDLLADGDDARDNVAGRLLGYGAQILSFSFEVDLHKDLEVGRRATYILMLEDLDPGADDPYVRGALFISVARNLQLESPPLWNGSDQFWLDATTVIIDQDAAAPDAGGADAGAVDGGDAAPPKIAYQPRYVFENGYVKNNVWVSGDFGKSPLTLPLYTFDPENLIDAETVTLVVELSPNRDKAPRSMLSAVVRQDKLQTQFLPIAERLVNCNATTASLLMGFVSSSMDLANAPPTFELPGSTCDAASIGFAFDWELVAEPAGPAFVPPAPGCGG